MDDPEQHRYSLEVTGAMKADSIVCPTITNLEKRIEDRLSLLEEQNQQLRDIIDTQNPIIQELWYCPGMPGANLAQENFEQVKEEMSKQVKDKTG